MGFPLPTKSKSEEEEEPFTVKVQAEEEEEASSFMDKIGCGSKRKAEGDDGEEEAAEKDGDEKAKEAAFLKAKAEEEEMMKASFEWDDDEVPYDKVCHESDAEDDMETFMARIEARWDVFIKEEEARFPGLTYRVDLPGEYSVDDPDDSDTEEEYYRRKLER